MIIRTSLLVIFLSGSLAAANGICPANEVVSLLRLEKVVGEWFGTHISGDKADCSRIQITAENEGLWRLERTSTIHGNTVYLSIRQPDRASGRLEAISANGSKVNISVLVADYNSHLLMQECTPDGNVTTSLLQRHNNKQKLLNGNTELLTALYDLTVAPTTALQFCQRNETCQKWPTIVSSLDQQRISGVWREAGRIRVPGSVQRRSCVFLTLKTANDGDGFSLIYSYRDDGRKVCLEKTAKYPYPYLRRGVLTFSDTDVGIEHDTSSGQLWILDTNYDSYALVSLCIPGDQLLGNAGGIIVLTRTGSVSSADAFAINAALISAGIGNTNEELNPGFDRLDSSLDIAPQSCGPEPVTCGAKFKYLSPFLLFALMLTLLV